MSDYFDAFWSIYPRKVAKLDAQKAASRIKPEEWPLVMEGLKKYLKIWIDKEKQFIPYPATFLNKRRFEDEIETFEEVKKESALHVFIKSVQNPNNTSMPTLDPDIKEAFFRMGIPWGKIKQMGLDEVAKKFETAYKKESPASLIDYKMASAGERE